MKLLAAGDLHLGRRPSRLPAALLAGGSSRSLGPSGAWERLIDAAIEEAVDVVVLAGDVVERENDFFEAYRELSGGVARLADAGIEVLGVAGNHDMRVLPRLAAQIDRFHLLGLDGNWEKWEWQAKGEAATLWGWSFGAERVRESPLAGRTFDRGPGPNIGILHCDRDQAASPYAPVASRELEAAGLDAWLLGHIHNPDPLSVRRPSGYLGSISGNDPGEPGARGPWLVTIEDGRIRAVEHWSLTPLRWETLAVDIEGVDEIEQVRDRLLSALRRLDETVSGGRWAPAAVGLRVQFIGRSGQGEAAVELFSNDDREQIHSGERGTHYFIERLENRTLPAVSLEKLAERKDPPGLLAARLLLLDRPDGDPDRIRLVTEARRVLERQAGDARWAGLQAKEIGAEATADWLRRTGMAVLEQLLAQREAKS